METQEGDPLDQEDAQGICAGCQEREAEVCQACALKVAYDVAKGFLQHQAQLTHELFPGASSVVAEISDAWPGQPLARFTGEFHAGEFDGQARPRYDWKLTPDQSQTVLEQLLLHCRQRLVGPEGTQAVERWGQQYRCGCFVGFPTKAAISKHCPDHLRDRQGVAWRLDDPEAAPAPRSILAALDAGDPNWRKQQRPNLTGAEQLWYVIRDIAELRRWLAGEAPPLPGSGLAVVRVGPGYRHLPCFEDLVDRDRGPMSLAAALALADKPSPRHLLPAPAETNGELYRALRVIAAAYRHCSAEGGALNGALQSNDKAEGHE